MNNLISQLMKSKNPTQSIMGMLNPQQRNLANNFMQQNEQQKAQYIADYCNQNGITRQQLADLINQFK